MSAAFAAVLASTALLGAAPIPAASAVPGDLDCPVSYGEMSDEQLLRCTDDEWNCSLAGNTLCGTPVIEGSLPDESAEER